MYDTPNHAGPLENRRPVSAGDVYAIFRKWLLVIVLVPLVMASIAVAYSFLQPSVYEASAKVLVGPGQFRWDELAHPDEDRLMIEAAVEVLTSRSVAAEAVKQLEAPQIEANAIVENLTAKPGPASQLIRLTYTDTDPTRAQKVVNAVGEVGTERISKQPINTNDIRAIVVEAATVPTTAEEPDPLRNGLLAAGLGIMLGFGLAFVLESLDPYGRLRRGPG
jgi:uncharacterized protein involved in exopolysaccharide biosynthesis